MRSSFVLAAGVEQQLGQVRAGQDVTGAKANRGRERDLSLLVQAGLAQRVSQMVVGIHMVRLELRGPPELARRRLEFLLRQQHQTELKAKALVVGSPGKLCAERGLRIGCPVLIGRIS